MPEVFNTTLVIISMALYNVAYLDYKKNKDMCVHRQIQAARFLNAHNITLTNSVNLMS